MHYKERYLLFVFINLQVMGFEGRLKVYYFNYIFIVLSIPLR